MTLLQVHLIIPVVAKDVSIAIIPYQAKDLIQLEVKNMLAQIHNATTVPVVVQKHQDQKDGNQFYL